MKKLILSGGLALLLASSISCEKACTEELRLFSTEVVDSTGQAFLLDRTFSVRTSTMDTVFSWEFDSLATSQYSSQYFVMQDLELDGTETIRFIGVKDSKVLFKRDFRFHWDGCHLEKVSGPDKIVVN